MVRVLFVITALALLLLSGTCSAAALEVVVVGLGSDEGDVHIAIYSSPDHFPYEEGLDREEKVLIKDRTARLSFENLEPGFYGIAVYHDKNGNHEFDQGIFGIPLEDYGFSNNAPVFFGPPTFEAAKVRVSAPKTTIEIDLGS